MRGKWLENAIARVLYERAPKVGTYKVQGKKFSLVHDRENNKVTAFMNDGEAIFEYDARNHKMTTIKRNTFVEGFSPFMAMYNAYGQKDGKMFELNFQYEVSDETPLAWDNDAIVGFQQWLWIKYGRMSLKLSPYRFFGVDNTKIPDYTIEDFTRDAEKFARLFNLDKPVTRYNKAKEKFSVS